ncbi:MAG: excinuclease ABC subunit A [Nitratiruptor sp.]|nr:excinuclease ABC subunit A [Nitratiruptor sp.]NPA83977.1 excinuclease ABC subunit UvrA [Campylobacterota bacterium]
MEWIKITGAREHNLKNISLQIPKNKLVVFTGLSGSGKSTLAFDTLYAEGQRRYIESLSSYARQFLERLDKPDVDKIEGLTPAVAIDQKSTSKNPRSTVGTVTEIYDYLRLLFARIGRQHCHKCGKPISSMGPEDIIAQILALPKGAKILLMVPLVREKKGEFRELLERLRREGFVRAMIDGIMVRLDEEIELAKHKKHTIKVVVDRLIFKEEHRERIVADVERALELGSGEVEVEILNAKELGIPSHHHFSQHLACFDCKVSFEPLEPLSFSFNSPKGACPACDGLGVRYTLDLERIIDGTKSLDQGAIGLFHRGSYYATLLRGFAKAAGIDTEVPYQALGERERKALLYGSGQEVEITWKGRRIRRPWPGLVAIAYEMLKEERELGEYMREERCPECGGHRLKAQSLAVKVAGLGIGEILDMPIQESYALFSDEELFAYLSPTQQTIARPILKELRERLFFLVDVGLGYLSLGRDARTISGGEAQRIRIASQIGSGLTGVLYVLDEPSIGLHERDTLRLIRTLKNLQQRGNSVIVVEHDRKTIEAADFIVDIGPGAGRYGGEVVFAGSYQELLESQSLTAAYLRRERPIHHFKGRPQKEWITLEHVNINNIHDLQVSIPLANLVAVTGVSGSGKSSLILQTLLPLARERLNRARKEPRPQGVEVKGLEMLDRVIHLDQSPIGRTPRSNPATYTGLMDEIRALFATTKEAKVRGYGPGRFSFNIPGGRCERCKGEGMIKVEMHFLPDIHIPCELCGGKRYNQQTLEVTYKGKSIADVLEMSVDEAALFFEAIPRIQKKLATLQQVGLGYITLGQSALTLSGGEAQRVKLAKELGRGGRGRTLYILDEPTTGLHFADIDRLVAVLQSLVDKGNSVIVIEHNLDVIKNADYIIDMGPEGGSGGGRIVATGSPMELAKGHKESGSYTGAFLAQELGL